MAGHVSIVCLTQTTNNALYGDNDLICGLILLHIIMCICPFAIIFTSSLVRISTSVVSCFPLYLYVKRDMLGRLIQIVSQSYYNNEIISLLYHGSHLSITLHNLCPIYIYENGLTCILANYFALCNNICVSCINSHFSIIR